MTTGFRTACLPRAGRAFGVRGVLAPLLGPRFLRSKATRRRVALQSFAKSSSESFTFLFAFIRVIRGLNFGCDGATLGRVVLNCSSNFRCRAPPRCASRFIPFSTKSSACERPAVADRDSSQKPNTALPSIFFPQYARSSAPARFDNRRPACRAFLHRKYFQLLLRTEQAAKLKRFGFIRADAIGKVGNIGATDRECCARHHAAAIFPGKSCAAANSHGFSPGIDCVTQGA